MKILRYLLWTMTGLFGVSSQAIPDPLAISDTPLFLSSRVDPNVLFDMSIESPMIGAAYNDQTDTSGCTGRPANEGGFSIGTCYFKTKTYLGYFDSSKCYEYSDNRFNPVSAATASYTVGATATCGGSYWSGNFLNWATMTAIDEFRWALTGGHRSSDTAALTVMERANQNLGKGHSWFPVKKVGAAIGPGNVATSTVTPYADATLYLYSHGVQLDVGTTTATNEKFVNRNVRVKACDSTVGLETNCKAYGTSNKPIGLIQRYSDNMRFALTSYLLDSTQSRDGGVLRSKMKYTGPNKYVIGTGTAANDNKEWSATDGTFVTNPDSSDATNSGVANSGVINYINKFGSNGYKGSDPAGELYYEALRYFKNLGPTPEYSSGLDATKKDGFPVITTWDDPIQAWCQKNFIVGINDANPWLDKKLPGTFFTCDKAGTPGMPATFTASDCGPPSNPDNSINVTTLTNSVGSMEGLNGTQWSNTGSWTSGSATGTNDSIGYFSGDANPFSCTHSKTITNLGEVMGTCPAPQKENSYYIAGLAYYANTQDIRSDLQGKQTIVTYMIDTQEYNTNPLDGNKNMLWLAGKYGGFIDSNDDGNPNASTSGSASAEWDSDSDGVPDNYVLATQPEKLVQGLSNAFSDIVKRTGSSSSVATSSSELKTGSKLFQAQFTSGEWSGTLVSNLIATGATQWDAASQVNTQVSAASDSRVIITKGSTGDGMAFAYANLTTAQKDALDRDESGNLDSRGSDRVSYLRGQSQHEGSAYTNFRQRPARKIGDIINSNPWFVGPPSAGYSDVDYAGYSSFRNAYMNRYPMVYVGANDGMLHGFNACEVGTNYPDSGSCVAAVAGTEAISYIPSVVYPNLSKLTAQNYENNHKFFVDGSPMAGDAYVNGSWRSVLVGSMNSGGKAYFALDVTNPANSTASSGTVFSETNAANLLLWEFTSSDDADLGLTYNLPPLLLQTGQPRQIVRMANNKWAAILGNGYNSTNGYAALMILFLDGPTGTGGVWTAGTDYLKIVADTSGSNGLSSPLPVDTDGDGYVDTVYAGDLKGHMWKFFVGPNASDATVTSSPATWKIALSGSPLFTAQDTASPANPQPIISPPVASLHPTTGWMVLFGTGKFLENSDINNTLVQTYYGIHDTNVAVSSRGELVGKVLSSSYPRVVSSTISVAVTDPPTTERGWYADLSISGERLVGRPTLENGLIFFDTITPTGAACSGGVSSGLQALDYLTGDMPDVSVFGNIDINSDGIYDLVAGISTGSALGGTTFIRIPGVTSTGTTAYRGLSSQLTGTVSQFDINVGFGSHGRITWREIVQ